MIPSYASVSGINWDNKCASHVSLRHPVIWYWSEIGFHHFSSLVGILATPSIAEESKGGEVGGWWLTVLFPNLLWLWTFTLEELVHFIDLLPSLHSVSVQTVMIQTPQHCFLSLISTKSTYTGICVSNRLYWKSGCIDDTYTLVTKTTQN